MKPENCSLSSFVVAKNKVDKNRFFRETHTVAKLNFMSINWIFKIRFFFNFCSILRAKIEFVKSLIFFGQKLAFCPSVRNPKLSLWLQMTLYWTAQWFKRFTWLDKCILKIGTENGFQWLSCQLEFLIGQKNRVANCSKNHLASSWK